MTETSQEVVQVDSPEAAVATAYETVIPTTPALQRMAAEAAALDTAYKMAVSLSKTTSVPQRYQQSYVPRGKSEPQGIAAAYDLAAAIMYGAELGMSALQSAQNVFSVHGQPAVYARTMVAQVRKWIDGRIAQGSTTADPETGDGIWEVSADPNKVVWAGRRAGRTASSEWTLQRATTAGFTSNEKYQKQPIEMLRAKAMTEVCRILFQDVLLGMAYSVEELQLSETVSVQVIRPATKQGGVGGLQAMLAERRQEKQQEVVDADPAPVMHPSEAGPADKSVEQDPVPEPTAADDAGAAATVRQITDVKRLLATVEKLTDPKHPDTLTLVGSLVGREISVLEDLTETEADSVIAVLTPNNKEKN